MPRPSYPRILSPRYAGIATACVTCFAVILLVAGGWLARQNLYGVEASGTLSDRVQSAQLAAERLLSTLKDAETGQRGYLLTGDPAYLEPYNSARERLDSDFVRMKQAPLWDAERGQRIARIRALATEKLAELARTVALREAGEPQAALAIVRTNLGERIMDAIRAEVSALQADSTAKLQAARARAASAGSWIVPAGLALLAFLMMFGVVLLQRRISQIVTLGFIRQERFARAFGVAQGLLRDQKGRITFWNSGSERLYGYSEAEAIGRVSFELLQSRFAQPLPDIEAALYRDGYWQGEVQQCRRDGTTLVTASQWALHPGREGEPDAVIEVNTDVTPLKQAEARLRLALDASGLGSWMWDVGRRTGELDWDERCKALFGLPPEAVVTQSVWLGAISPDDRPRVEALLARMLDPRDPDDGFACEYSVVHPDGAVRQLAITGRATFVPDPAAQGSRRAVRSHGTVADVTDLRRLADMQRRTDVLLRSIVETAPGLIYAKDRQGRMVLANGAALDLIGKPWAQVEGRTDLEFLDDQTQGATIMANDRRVMESGQTEELEELVGYTGNQVRIWLSTKTPMRDESGTVTGLVGVSVEITERKQMEDRLRLMVDELNHRVKNTLATVQSIARHTMRGIDPGIIHVLEGRLKALAAAHDVLTREHWQGAELSDVVTGTLMPHGLQANGRLKWSGPPLHLQPRAAVALSLGLHELATNAVKYGALSREPGRVELHWSIEGGRLRLVWCEHDGPAVTPPARRGFGTRLIERSLAQDLGGTAAIDFRAGGVECVVDAPLAEVAAAAQVLVFPRIGSAGNGD